MDQNGASDSGARGLSSANSGRSVAPVAYWLVVVLFFVSGFSSLVYQVVWTRSLVFVFGSTTFASSTVLAVFMGGLALGSFVAGRLCNRLPIRSTFLWYGLLEGIIGLWAILAPFLFEGAIPLYRVIWQALHVSVLPFSILRFLIATAILLLPTTCMGATLPLLARFVAVGLKEVGERIGTLYSVNTLGAVVGSMLAGFYLLPNFGISATTYFSAVCNLLLCIIVVVLNRSSGESQEPASVSDADPTEQQLSSKLPQQVIAMLIAFAVSGAVAMIYEVAWTRTLLMVIGSTTYAFTIMLSTFLVGIFAGSLIAAKLIDKSKEPFGWFAACQLFLSLAGLGSLLLFNMVPYWSLLISSWNPANPEFAFYLKFLLSAAILLPITLFLGAMFPIAVKVATQDIRFIGRSVGSLYSSNTLGAIVGAFLAGFVIIPQLGVERTLLMCIGVNLLVGVTLGRFTAGTVRKLLLAAAAVPLVAIAGTVLFGAAAWDHLILLSVQPERRLLGKFKEKQLSSFGEFFKWVHGRRRLLNWYDGACSTVGVFQEGPNISLLTNGHVDASNGADMATQIMLSGFPMLVDPQATEIAVVGWGSGVSAGTAVLKPDAKICGIEIEPTVIDASKRFASVNFQAYDNPRVTMELNDGRNYLLASDRKFDVIVSEPSNPWQAGVCNLFTKEFFASTRRCLTDKGVLSLWLQLSEISPDSIMKVLAALKSQYQYVMPMRSNAGNLVVCASSSPMRLNYQMLCQAEKNGWLKKQLEVSNLRSADEIIARIVATPQGIDTLVAKHPEPNSDDRNNLEYQVSRTYESAVYRAANNELFSNDSGDLWSCVDWGTMSPSEKAAAMYGAAKARLTDEDAVTALKWAGESIRLQPTTQALLLCAAANYELGNDKESETYLTKAFQLHTDDKVVLLDLAKQLRTAGRLREASEVCEKLLKLDPSNIDANYELALDLMPSSRRILAAQLSEPVADNAGKAKVYCNKVLSDSNFVQKHSQALFLQAAILNDEGKQKESAQILHDYLKIELSDVAAWRMLAAIQVKLGQSEEAAQSRSQSEKYALPLFRSLSFDAKRMATIGKSDTAVKLLEKCVELCPADKQPIAELENLSKTNQKAAEALKRIQSGG